MHSSPWDTMPTPQSVTYFKTRKIGEDLNPAGRPAYWALDYEGSKAVYFEYPQPKRRLKRTKAPSFKALTTRDISLENGSDAFAVILVEDDMDDIFYEMCCDLILSIQDFPAEMTRTILIRRLEKWKALMSGGHAGLSKEAQRGLFAELLFIEDYVLTTVSEIQAMQGWVGPESASQDFRFGQTGVEVKSKHGSSTHKVKISSEDQLKVNESERLFLCVTEINESNNDNGLSLSNLVRRINKKLSFAPARSLFSLKLLAVGYDPNEDYDTAWTIGETHFYEVIEGFPRIVDAQDGVSRISYVVDLEYCKDYIIDAQSVRKSIRGL